MATHLTVEDLANFLRSRKSADCHIAGDWVTDHPTDHRVVAALDELEVRILTEGNRLWQVERGGAFIEAIREVPGQQVRSHFQTASLSLFAERFHQPDIRCFNSLVEVVKTHVNPKL